MANMSMLLNNQWLIARIMMNIMIELALHWQAFKLTIFMQPPYNTPNNTPSKSTICVIQMY